MKTENSDKALEILYNKYKFDSSEMGWAVGYLKEWYDNLPQVVVGGSCNHAYHEARGITLKDGFICHKCGDYKGE
jgi:hypothetical protein